MIALQMGAGVNLLLGQRCWLYPASIRPSLVKESSVGCTEARR